MHFYAYKPPQTQTPLELNGCDFMHIIAQNTKSHSAWGIHYFRYANTKSRSVQLLTLPSNLG